MKIKKVFYILFAFASYYIHAKNQSHTIHISSAQAKKIGQQIWKNEGAGQVEKLTWWNDGEHFASMGIGHFIWYPKGAKKTFSESFPQLITFLARHKKLPAFLAQNKALTCPWKNKEEFFAAANSKEMKELRKFLADTIDLQTQFIVQRLERAMPSMLKKLPAQKQLHVKKQFYRIAHSSPTGLYALIDYVNFKGEGINEREHYNGHGWGLLQVLQAMQGEGVGTQALEDFSATALALLTKRVEHAPAGKDEARWLPGWKNRLATYKQS